MISRKRFKFILFLLRHISVIKTIVFNFNYFGFRGIIIPVLISKNFRLVECKGSVKIRDFRPGKVKLGFPLSGLYLKGNGVWKVSDIGRVTFEGRTLVGTGAVFSVDGELAIGRDTSISDNTKLLCQNQIIIGEDSMISWGCTIMDSDLHIIHPKLKEENSILIGTHTWLGMESVILKGAIIGEGSIVAARGVVTKTIGKNQLVGG